MREAPTMRFTLGDRVSWEFKHNHGALYELTQHAGASDPIAYILEAMRADWTTCYMWELAWAFSYEHRQKTYASLSFVQFLALLPVAEEWVDLGLKLVKLVIDGLPKPPTEEESAIAKAIAANNPPVPQPDGTGATDFTPEP